MFIFKTGDHNDLIRVAVSQKARKAGNLDGVSLKWGCWTCFFLFEWLWLIGAAETHYRHSWTWNEISSHFPMLFWLARADSRVSVQGGQRSLDAQNDSPSAEDVGFNINLLDAQITCNDLTGSWSVSPDRFQKREKVLSLRLERFPKAFGCCSARDPEGFPSCPLWAGPAQPTLWCCESNSAAHPNWSNSSAGS